ncbi:MAG TPA: hypothetical protein VNC50_09935 [Planctomycetia bacterium]|nr:hypothetical protein [Planctomycetia bacterium]
MTEPAVALTDFALAAEAAYFANFVYRRRGASPGSAGWLVLFFMSVGVAALVGGLVHGFFQQSRPDGKSALWRLTLLAIGTATLAKWSIGARMLLQPAAARLVTRIAMLQFIAYAITTLFYFQGFLIAVLDNAPAAIFLLVAMALTYRRRRDPRFAAGAAGMGLTLLAGLLQQQRVGLHADHFNHNAVYHVLQGIALYLVFLGAIAVLDEPRRSSTSEDDEDGRGPDDRMVLGETAHANAT